LDSGYTVWDINYAESFITLTPVANISKKLHGYRHIAVSFNSSYTAREVNYSEKSFITLTLGANVIKLFLSIIYGFSQ
jgi:hypothetical protein